MVALAAGCTGPGRDAENDNGTGASLTAVETTSIPATSTTMSLPTVQLERVEHGAWADLGRIQGVTAFGRGLIAVGTVAQDSLDAAVWTSADALEWVRVAAAPGVFDDGENGERVDQVMLDVASGPTGVVAVGYQGTPTRYDGVVWVWPLGADWERVAGEVFGGEGVQQLRAACHTADSIVVVGEAAGRAAVWVSTASFAGWREAVVSGPPSDGASDRTSVMNDVACDDDGCVAVGRAGSEPAVWLSSDGTTWNQVPGLDVGGGGVLRRAAILDGGTVLAVGDLEGEPLVMTSPDGFDWQVLDAAFNPSVPPSGRRGPYEYLKGASSVFLTDLVVVADRIVAVGRYPIAPSGLAVPEFVTLWISLDGGTTWLESGEQVMEASDSQLGRGAYGLVVSGGRVVLVGADDEPTRQHEAGWWYYAPTAAVWTAAVP